MFLRSFSHLLRDTFLPNTGLRYKVQDLHYYADCIKVSCEILENGETVKFKLNDIINTNKLHLFSSSDILSLYKASEIEGKKMNTDSNTGVKDYKYYNIISLAFILCLLMSNLAAIKIFNFFGHAIWSGILIFPLIYVLNDVLTEVYGFSESRKVIWVAMACNCILSGFLYFVCLLPPAEFWQDQAAFEKVFSLSPRIVAASVISYLIGETMNSYILSLLKIRLYGKFFAIRAIISTLVGAFVESSIFGFISFGGRVQVSELWQMICMLAFMKVGYEILIMPFTVKFVTFLKRKEKVNSFEIPSLRNIIPFIPNF